MILKCFKGLIKLKHYKQATKKQKNMASSKMVIFGKDFNPRTDIVIKERKANKNGNGFSAGIVNSKTSRSLFIQTPMMLTWGVNEIRDKETKKLQGYSMSLQFPRDEDDNNDAEMKAFFKAMDEFDKVICDEAKANSQKWCKKKKLTNELLEAYFDSRTVKYPRYPEDHEHAGEINHERKPTLRIKLPYYNEEFNTEIYDVSMKRLFPRNPEGLTPPDIIGKGDNVIVIMQCGGVWFAGSRFGVTWKLHQVILQKKENLRGRCFIQLSDKQRDIMSTDEPVKLDEDELPQRTVSASNDDDEAEADGDEAEADGDEADGGESLADVLNKGPRMQSGLKLPSVATAGAAADEPDIDLEGLEDDLN